MAKDADWPPLRKLAKANGINCFQKSKEALLAELRALGVEYTPAVVVPVVERAIPVVKAETAVEVKAVSEETKDKPLTPEVKKGYPSWRPASRLDVSNKTPGYRYRLCVKDPAEVERRLAEGWIIVNKTTGISGELEQRDHTANSKAGIDGAQSYRELIVMVLPEELGKQRDEYYKDKTRKQTVGLKSELDKANRDAARQSGVKNPAQLHGSIVIS